MSVSHHKATAPSSLAVAVLTVSDTRTQETDESGRLIRDLAAGAGLRIASRRIVPDDPGRIREAVEALLSDEGVDAVILNGGTGISPRDRTHEAVAPVLEIRMEGFGELFRALSYEEIGPGAMLSRALAGTAGGKAVFALPGSRNAVRLAMEKLILPELGHIVGEARKGESPGRRG